jgi:hypothetical protein
MASLLVPISLIVTGLGVTDLKIFGITLGEESWRARLALSLYSPNQIPLKFCSRDSESQRIVNVTKPKCQFLLFFRHETNKFITVP